MKEWKELRFDPNNKKWQKTKIKFKRIMKKGKRYEKIMKVLSKIVLFILGMKKPYRSI